jgi:hypothetical protein
LNHYYHQSIIEDKEYKTIKDIIDQKILSIQRTIPEWVILDLLQKEDSKNQLIKSIPMFRFVSEQKIQELIGNSAEL